MNMNAQLQFADAADASKLWQIPDAETLRIKDDSTFRYAVVAVAFGLFVFFYPILSGMHITWAQWDLRMWHGLMQNQWV